MPTLTPEHIDFLVESFITLVGIWLVVADYGPVSLGMGIFLLMRGLRASMRRQTTPPPFTRCPRCESIIRLHDDNR